jgi:hypothetical protein
LLEQVEIDGYNKSVYETLLEYYNTEALPTELILEADLYSEKAEESY